MVTNLSAYTIQLHLWGGKGKKHKQSTSQHLQKTEIMPPNIIFYEKCVFQALLYHFLSRPLFRIYLAFYLSPRNVIRTWASAQHHSDSHINLSNKISLLMDSHENWQKIWQELYHLYWGFNPLLPSFSPSHPWMSKKQERQDLEIKSNVQFIFITWNWNKRCFERAYKWNGRHMLNSTLWQ